MKSRFLELKKKNILTKNKIILSYVDLVVNSIKHNFFKDNYFQIPKTEVQFYFKKKLLDNFNFSKNKFNIKVSIISIPKYMILYLAYIFRIILFRKKGKTKVTYYKTMIDHIETDKELNLYKKIINLYKKKDIIIRATNPSVRHKQSIFSKKMKDYIVTNKDILFLIKFFFSAMNISLKYKINFFYISIKFIDDCFFYKSFFKKIKSKNIIMHQHYYSNIIKNFFFKKNGGNKSCLIQKNINTKNTNGFFYHADILFSFGANINISNKKNFFKIKRNVNIGSFVMGSEKNITLRKNKRNIDILYIGGNGLFKNSYYDTYDTYKKDYIEQLKWLAKISIKFPKLKIYFKHHPNNYENEEKFFFINSNVKFIDQKKNTYHLCNQSKFICSWASTMIIEYKNQNYYSFFLDPKNKNDQFLSDINQRHKISIDNYNKFEQLVLSSQNKIYKDKKDKKFCMINKNIFNNIFKNLDYKSRL